MQRSRGLLVAIEGIDGSGKGTQARILLEQLRSSGISSTLISFPRYDATFFGKAIGDFLDGRFGSLASVHPLLASLLFAGDRFESLSLLTESLSQHDVVVLDRYVASNVAHQSAKATGPERDELRRSIEDLEFRIFGLPQPDAVILLDLSIVAAQDLIRRKPTRAYTARQADIQEADAQYLADVRDVYSELARSDARWTTICCQRGEILRSIEDIGDEIWQNFRRVMGEV